MRVDIVIIMILSSYYTTYSLIFLATLSTLVASTDGLTINGSGLETKDFNHKIRTLCEYFQQIESLFLKAEVSGDPIHVAWIYGYFSAMFSAENDKLKTIIKAYMTKEIVSDDSKLIYQCLKDFSNKLSLNSYIYQHPNFNPEFKKLYLVATEDIRSLMDSGVASSFYMHSKNDSDNLVKRFIGIYKNRNILSDPINKIFSLLAVRNCSNRECFIDDILTWSQCDGSYKHFIETLQFFNSMQRYLISSLFVEDLYILLNSAELNSSRKYQQYEEQLVLHRLQYREISFAVVDGLRKCYQSLQKLKQRDYYALGYRKSSSCILYNLVLCGVTIFAPVMKFY